MENYKLNNFSIFCVGKKYCYFIVFSIKKWTKKRILLELATKQSIDSKALDFRTKQYPRTVFADIQLHSLHSQAKKF